MTSKEALDWLVNYLAPFHFHANKEQADKINNVLLTLKQDLERLEDYKREVTITKNNNILLVERNIELSKQNEKLKKVISILKGKLSIVLTHYYEEDYHEIDITHIDYVLTQQEYELLKEVLDNDSYK